MRSLVLFLALVLAGCSPDNVSEPEFDYVCFTPAGILQFSPTTDRHGPNTFYFQRGSKEIKVDFANCVGVREVE